MALFQFFQVLEKKSPTMIIVSLSLEMGLTPKSYHLFECIFVIFPEVVKAQILYTINTTMHCA